MSTVGSSTWIRRPHQTEPSRAAQFRRFSSPAENIGITNTKAFVTARIPMGQPH
jgi:hypothetical protein